METVDYTESEFRYELEGSKNYGYENESFGAYGYQTQEFNEDNGTLENAEETEEAEDSYDEDAFEEAMEFVDSLDD